MIEGNAMGDEEAGISWNSKCGFKMDGSEDWRWMTLFVAFILVLSLFSEKSAHLFPHVP
jgi:hypothetical protein